MKTNAEIATKAMEEVDKRSAEIYEKYYEEAEQYQAEGVTSVMDGLLMSLAKSLALEQARNELLSMKTFEAISSMLTRIAELEKRLDKQE